MLWNHTDIDGNPGSAASSFPYGSFMLLYRRNPHNKAIILQLKINLKGNNKNRLTHIENRLVVAKRDGGEEDWEFGISRCKQLHIRWINSEVLLRSTGNCTQYPVISHMEKNMKMNNHIHN